MQKHNSLCSPIKYYNFFDLDPETFWFSKFIKSRTHLLQTDKQIAFISVFGNRNKLKYANHKLRIFWTGENVRNDWCLEYADNMLSDDTINLSLGFDYFEDKRYLRFPIWFLYMFDPEETDDQICTTIQNLRKPKIGERRRFCSMVASHDINHIRENITKSISPISEVSCGGNLMHNDDSLRVDFNDSKREYLQQFIFNICPENSNAYGYVTEKIFECIQSGCIPIYWGSYNNPEHTIINKESVIFFEPGKDNSKQIAFIEELYSHPKLLSEFQNQERLLPNAEESILNTVHELVDKINGLIA